MNFEKYKTAFTEEAIKSGYSYDTIEHCMNYASKLIKNGVPIIYNSTHLSLLVGYKKQYLKKAALYSNHFYRDFTIIKKNGKKRIISEPLPSLMEIQQWILQNILYQVPVSPFAKAYKPKTSLSENLKFHKKQRTVFTLDLENFFPSISADSIEKVFIEMGYSNALARLLSQLCTRDNSLPQGAPTSPYLSNLIFREADKSIANYCIANRIRYTRYADDLSFSGDFDSKSVLHFVTNVVEQLGCKINTTKTKLMTPNMRQTVTGIVVNDKPQVVFHKRNALRQAMYYIQKYGIDEHIAFRDIRQSNYLQHLLGKINFVLQINPNDPEFIGYKSFLIALKKKQSNHPLNAVVM
ncbi:MULTISPECIES: reverse transcriptase family protein [unclassified Flavobacterium]|uniref:reverse transcriptase family protein n=1 Tax=unclassified Flavobacterium TaxID=196869 RepID=UPI003F9031EB